MTAVSPLAYVYDGRRCLGHIIARGKAGFEAFRPLTTGAWAYFPRNAMPLMRSQAKDKGPEIPSRAPVAVGEPT